MANKKQNKSVVRKNNSYLLLILFFLVIGLVLGWKLLGTPKKVQNSTCSYEKLIPEKFQDISKFVDTESCRNMAVNWKTEKSDTYGFIMKKPASYLFYEEMGAVNIYPNAKKYPEGFLSDIGTLNGSFSENMCNLADIGHIAKDSTANQYFFNKLNGRYYVVGGNYFVVGGGVKHEAEMMAFNWNNNEMINQEVKCFLSLIEN